MRSGFAVGAMTLAISLVHSGPSFSEGALAVGVPPKPDWLGVSMGLTANKATVDEAKRVATEACKLQGSVISKLLCKVVATFSNQCAALALDPEVGMKGFGWAIANSGQAAANQAILNCRETAGPGRAEACVIMGRVVCDGSAN